MIVEMKQSCQCGNVALNAKDIFEAPDEIAIGMIKSGIAKKSDAKEANRFYTAANKAEKKPLKSAGGDNEKEIDADGPEKKRRRGRAKLN